VDLSPYKQCLSDFASQLAALGDHRSSFYPGCARLTRFRAVWRIAGHRYPLRFTKFCESAQAIVILAEERIVSTNHESSFEQLDSALAALRKEAE